LDSGEEAKSNYVPINRDRWEIMSRWIGIGKEIFNYELDRLTATAQRTQRIEDL